MQNLILRVALILALLGTFSHPGKAQTSKSEVPRLITYQAQLLDKDGIVVKDGEYAVTAKLYTDADGDDLLWGDTYIVETHNGVVDLALGSGDEPLPASTDMSRALWLGISLNGAEEMRPLLAFSAVPYSLNVADNSITASKMATDYLASFSINGQQITGRGGKIDLYAGNGVKLAYDSISNQLLIMGADRAGNKGEPEVLTVSLYAKEDLVVDGNATFNVDSGKTDMRGNVILGGSASKTLTFKAKAASDLDMNLNSIHYVDSLTLGKIGTKRGYIDLVSEKIGTKVTIMADTMVANRKYTIPDVGEDSRFLMTSGLQSLDTVIFTNILIPTNDNAYALGDPDLRYRDIYMGPGSLHLIASVDEGVVEEKDYAQQIDVTDSEGNGDLVFRESGEDLLRVTSEGDVTVTGSTSTAGIETSENITPTEDNYVQIGAPDARVADLFLGPSSLHLIAGVDDGLTADVDYAQQVDTEDGAGSGDLVIRESGEDLMRIAPTGDVTVSGSTSTAGIETSEDITPTEDNYVQIGSEEARIADLFLGPSSLHLIAGVDDGLTAEVDYAQQVDTEDGAGSGDLVIRESGEDLMRIAPTGDVTVMGSTSTAGIETSENITPTEDNYVQIGSEEARIADIYLGPSSLHLIAGVDDGLTAEVDYAQQVDTEDGAGSGDLVIRESGEDLMRIAPTGDVTVMGSTSTAGIETSENITPTEDNYVQIGSQDARIADIYLGPTSLHLIAGVDDGLTAEVDYAQQVDTEDGAGSGDLVIRESGEDLMRISPDGDVNVTGTTTTAGIESSEDILPAEDNAITLGDPSSRYMDVFVGPGSIHVSGSSVELDGAPARDWALDLLQSGPNAGNFQILEGSNLALSLTPDGNAAITGKVTSAATLGGDGTATLTTKGYVDMVGASQWGIAGNTGLTTDNYIGTNDATPFIVRTSGSERMRVLADGKVGIGTTSPLTALDVNGGLYVTGPATVVGTLNFNGSLYGVGNGSVTGSFAAVDLMAGSISPAEAGSVTVYDGNSSWGTFATSDLSTDRSYTLPNASGTVALTSDIANTTWLRGGNTGLSGSDWIGTTDAASFVVKVNGTPRMTLAADGNHTINGNMTNFVSQMQVQGGIEVWNGISVHGDTWMEGGNINLSGPTTINSNLSVFGTTNTINGTTNNLNGTLNVAGTTTIGGTTAINGTTTIGGTTTINGTTIINGAFDGDLVHATQLDADALAGDIDGSGYSISNLGQIYGEIFNVSNQLNVANVGGHTMVGDINMNENDILNPFSITGVNVFTTHDATVTGLLNPTQVGGFTMVGGINMNNQDINNVDQADFNQVATDQLVGGMITATTGLIAEDELRIQQGSGPYSAFEANPAQSSNITYTLPAQQGNPGTVLQNNGSGGLGWGTMVHREVVTHNVASIPANSAVTFTLSVNGAPLGSAVYVSPGGDMIGGLFIGHCRVSATDTVEIRIVNMSPNPVDLPSMDWYFGIIR